MLEHGGLERIHHGGAPSLEGSCELEAPAALESVPLSQCMIPAGALSPWTSFSCSAFASGAGVSGLLWTVTSSSLAMLLFPCRSVEILCTSASPRPNSSKQAYSLGFQYKCEICVLTLRVLHAGTRRELLLHTGKGSDHSLSAENAVHAAPGHSHDWERIKGCNDVACNLVRALRGSAPRKRGVLGAHKHYHLELGVACTPDIGHHIGHHTSVMHTTHRPLDLTIASAAYLAGHPGDCTSQQECSDRLLILRPCKAIC